MALCGRLGLRAGGRLGPSASDFVDSIAAWQDMRKSEIVDAVVELVQDQSAAMRANIGRWVNLVLDDIASRGLLHSLQREERATMVAGNGVDMNAGRNYDLNTDTDKVYKVFVPALGTDGILTKISQDKFLNKMMLDGPVLRGKPEFYCIFGLRTLRLHPIPSLDYAPVTPTDLQKLYVWKYKDPASLTENEEITEWKLKHTPCIIAGAYCYGARFDSLGDYSVTKLEYETLITRMFGDQETDLDRPRATAYNDT